MTEDLRIRKILIEEGTGAIICLPRSLVIQGKIEINVVTEFNSVQVMF